MLMVTYLSTNANTHHCQCVPLAQFPQSLHISHIWMAAASTSASDTHACTMALLEDCMYTEPRVALQAPIDFLGELKAAIARNGS